MNKALLLVLLTVILAVMPAYAATDMVTSRIEVDSRYTTLSGYCNATAPVNYTVVFGYKWFENGTMVENQTFYLGARTISGVEILVDTYPLQPNMEYIFECLPYSYDSSLVDIVFYDDFDNGNYTSESWQPLGGQDLSYPNYTQEEQDAILGLYREEDSMLVAEKSAIIGGSYNKGFARSQGGTIDDFYELSFFSDIYALPYATSSWMDIFFQVNGIAGSATPYHPDIELGTGNRLMQIEVSHFGTHTRFLGYDPLPVYVKVHRLNVYVDGYYKSGSTIFRRTIMDKFVNVFADDNDDVPTPIKLLANFNRNSGNFNLLVSDVLQVTPDEFGHYESHLFGNLVFTANINNQTVWPDSIPQEFNTCFNGDCTGYTDFRWYNIFHSGDARLRRNYTLDDINFELSTVTALTVNETGTALNSSQETVPGGNSTIEVTRTLNATNKFSSVHLTNINNHGCVAAGFLDAVAGRDVFVASEGGSGTYVYLPGSDSYTLEQRLSFPRQYKYCRAAAVDYDNDGDTDIIVAGAVMPSETPTIDIWLNRNEEAFDLVYSHPAEDSFVFFDGSVDWNSWTYGDIDNNGYVDFLFNAINSTGDDEIMLVKGLSGSSMASAPSAVTALTPVFSDMELMDIDLDGYSDLLYDSRMYRWFGNKFVDKGAFTPYETHQMVLHDVDSNGYPELAMSYSIADFNSKTLVYSLAPWEATELASVPLGIGTGGADWAYNIGEVNDFTDFVFIGEDFNAVEELKYRKYAAEYDHITQELTTIGLTGAFSGAQNGDVIAFDAEGDGDSDLLVRLPEPEGSECEDDDCTIPLPVLPNPILDPQDIEDGNQPLGFVDEDGNIVDLVNPDNPNEGLLPEIGLGMMEFFSGAGTKTIYLFYAIAAIAIVLAIVGLLVAMIRGAFG